MSRAARPLPWRFVSALSHDLWPAVPNPDGAFVLALLFQLERTQWLPPERLRELQSQQLDVLLRHACETVPFYRARWGAVPDAARLGDLPILTRRELQENFDALRSGAVPPQHGGIAESRTSGSTGAPVRVLKTALEGLFWRAITLRDHRWHQRDLGATLAVIRRGVTPGESPSWGAATEGLVETGKCVLQEVNLDVETLLDWLSRTGAGYLLTYPSLAAELARAALARGVRIPGLREVRTLGEALDPEARALCREAWGAPLTDMYTAEEVGYIALQCPEHEHYHVQCESVLVEVLDERGKPCAPGETGRLVLTSLHNFALPLVRYEIGDYAEVGEPCPCGRGLPVLRRVAGRVRNTLVTADGRRYWPHFGSRRLHEIAPIRQHQFVQKDFESIEARLATDRALTREEEEALRRYVLERLPPDMRLTFSYRDEIARAASGKFEDFVSEVAEPRPVRPALQ